MNNIAILDPILGDSGKGRVSHWFSSSFDWIIRPNSGSNAGHQIYRNGKKYSHHLLPCANYNNTRTKSFLASGMMINLQELLDEIKLFETDYPNLGKNIFVDPDAFIVSDAHITIDKSKNSHLMTTGKGMGPATIDKYSRNGVRIYDLINDNADIIQALKSKGVNFKHLLSLKEEFEKSNLLFEGAQGVLLDLQSGIYPYVTSADTTVSGIYSAGFHFIKLNRVYGVIKPYWTKSGAGPLPTEMNEEESNQLREKAGEYGVTTGRNRRIAYMDLPMLKYGVKRGGITHLVMTKLDIMNGQKTIKICTDYGKEVHSPNDFKDAKPRYIDVPGWTDARDMRQVAPFIQFIEDHIGVPVEFLSVGVNDEDMISLEGLPQDKAGERRKALEDLTSGKLAL